MDKKHSARFLSQPCYGRRNILFNIVSWILTFRNRHSKFILNIYFCFYLCVCFSCIYVCDSCTCLVPAEAWEGHQIPWDWSDRQFWATLWVLGSKLRSSARTAPAFYCWATASVWRFSIFKNWLKRSAWPEWWVKYWNVTEFLMLLD